MMKNSPKDIMTAIKTARGLKKIALKQAYAAADVTEVHSRKDDDPTTMDEEITAL